MIRIAVLDDYNHVALRMADWSAVQQRCKVDVLDRPLAVPDEAAQVLAPYDVLCHLRERLPMNRGLIERLPNLKLMTITGQKHRTMDIAAASARGIVVSSDAPKPGTGNGTTELAWGLVFALARHIPQEDRNIRQGRWQQTIGITLARRTLGLVGLGRIGREMATVGKAFGMNVVAWSQNMTAEAAAACGARLVTKDELFGVSDVVSLHLVLSERSRHTVGARELALMKPSAYLINTSRGPLVDEAALVAALQARRIAGAGIDVFEREPVEQGHPLLVLDNVVLTPHLGYVVEESFRDYYEGTVESILAWLDGRPIRVVTE